MTHGLSLPLLSTEHKSNTNAQKNGRSLLAAVVAKKKTAVTTLLEMHTPEALDLTIQNKKQQTAYIIAREGEDQEMIALFRTFATKYNLALILTALNQPSDKETARKAEAERLENWRKEAKELDDECCFPWYICC